MGIGDVTVSETWSVLRRLHRLLSCFFDTLQSWGGTVWNKKGNKVLDREINHQFSMELSFRGLGFIKGSLRLSCPSPSPPEIPATLEIGAVEKMEHCLFRAGFWCAPSWVFLAYLLSSLRSQRWGSSCSHQPWLPRHAHFQHQGYRPGI